MNINYAEQIKTALGQMPAWFVSLFCTFWLLGVLLAARCGYSHRIRRHLSAKGRPGAEQIYLAHSSLNIWLWGLVCLVLPVIGTLLMIAAAILVPKLKYLINTRAQTHPTLWCALDPELPCPAAVFLLPPVTGWLLGLPLQPMLFAAGLDRQFPQLMEIQAPILQIAAAVWAAVSAFRLLRTLRGTLWVCPHPMTDPDDLRDTLRHFRQLTVDEVRAARDRESPFETLGCFADPALSEQYPPMLRQFASTAAKGERLLPAKTRTDSEFYLWQGTDYAVQYFRVHYHADAALLDIGKDAPVILITDPCAAIYRGCGVTEIAVLLWQAEREAGVLRVDETKPVYSGSVWRVMLPLRYWIAETLTSALGVLLLCTPAGAACLAGIVNLAASFFR